MSPAAYLKTGSLKIPKGRYCKTPVYISILGTLKRLLIVVIVLFTVSRIKGQTIELTGPDPYPDSLQRLIKITPTDTDRAQLYFLLSDYWSDKDSTKAQRYIDAYFREGISNDYYDALAHFYRAGAYFDYNFQLSQQEYMAAEKLFSNYSTRDAILYRARSWHNYGVLEQKKDNSREFVDIQLNKAIPLALEAGDTTRVASNYKEVGMVFMNFEEYGKAQEYYRRALSLLIRPSVKGNLSDADREAIADCYIDIAKAHLLNEDPRPARAPLDSAAMLLAPLPQSTYQPARYWAEGMYHARKDDWQNAIDSLDKGLSIARHLNRGYDMSSILFEKYDVYKRRKKYAEAREILQQVYQYSQLMPLTNNRRLILHELAETEAALGHEKEAYQWLDQYSKLSDSVAKAGTTVQIAALEAKFKSSEKERALLELHNKSKIQRILLGGGIILLSVILLFFLYRSRRLKLEGRQQLQSLQQQQQIELTSALLNGEERERRRLARDLHDGLGGTLAGIKVRLSEQDNPALQKIIKELDNAVRELRHIAHNMMPESLIRSGLEVALNDLCESSGNGRTKVVLQMMDISSDLPKPTQLMIYRIVQELLSNVIKHARATEVFVQCSQTEDIFYITVEDDGVGFDKELLKDRKGIGLDNIRHRVGFLKGRLEIDTETEKGTTVNIEINVA